MAKITIEIEEGCKCDACERLREISRQKDLIVDLVKALETVDGWLDRRNICTAIGMQVDIKRVLELAKAEGRE